MTEFAVNNEPPTLWQLIFTENTSHLSTEELMEAFERSVRGVSCLGLWVRLKDGEAVADLMVRRRKIFGGSIMVLVYVLIGFGWYVPFMLVHSNDTAVIWNQYFIELVLFGGLMVLPLQLVSYLVAAYSDPGFTRDGAPPTISVPQCQKCGLNKPERAHHCKVCRRCVLKMDHHCPWLNNCVGERNMKPFALFTMYTAVVTTFGAFMDSYFLYQCSSEDGRICGEGWGPYVWVHAIVLTALAVYSWLILKNVVDSLILNQTIIELRQAQRTSQRAGAKKGTLSANAERDLFKYDLGRWRNIIDVLGPNPFTWQFPTLKKIHDPYRWNRVDSNYGATVN